MKKNKITILHNKKGLNLDFSECNTAAYSDLLNIFLNAIGCITEEILKENDDEEKKNYIHDLLSGAFTSFITGFFPEEDDGAAFTNAAIVLAQDELIQRSVRENKPVEELIDEYNARAEEYIKEKRQCQS